MAEWDTLKAEGDMLEVARACLILPSSRWDLPNPVASEPASGESQVVVSFVPFYLAGFGVPVHLFVGRFLRYFGLWLHDLTLHGVAHLAVFVILYKCYLGIEPYFHLWRRIFRLNLNKDGARSVQRISVAAIHLCNNLKLRYLELSFPTSKKGWHRKWFYLLDPFGSLPSYSPDHLGLVAPLSWKRVLEGPALEVADKGLAPFLLFEPRPDELPYLGRSPFVLAPWGRGPRVPSGVLPRHRGACPLAHPWEVICLLLDNVDVDRRESSSIGASGGAAALFRPLVLKVRRYPLLPPQVGEVSMSDAAAEGPVVEAPTHPVRSAPKAEVDQAEATVPDLPLAPRREEGGPHALDDGPVTDAWLELMKQRGAFDELVTFFYDSFGEMTGRTGEFFGLQHGISDSYGCWR
ncbi:unnamed protein product [Miscanthus lutarioriparius]|uniref:Transposase (putative) gypsy type domain-containing protein n=1 Tax=Miscanthus lutarioriparius TaxID=422564 RepID=A0A811R749_9POAL|nr:unnamed protein product [Miscanthus lutarioriparius]